jgi:hypothetical protein
MWLIKRVLVDKWDNDRALEEASQLGSISPVRKAFALDYIQAHKKSFWQLHYECEDELS